MLAAEAIVARNRSLISGPLHAALYGRVTMLSTSHLDSIGRHWDDRATGDVIAARQIRSRAIPATLFVSDYPVNTDESAYGPKLVVFRSAERRRFVEGCRTRRPGIKIGFIQRVNNVHQSA